MPSYDMRVFRRLSSTDSHSPRATPDTRRSSSASRTQDGLSDPVAVLPGVVEVRPALFHFCFSSNGSSSSNGMRRGVRSFGLPHAASFTRR